MVYFGSFLIKLIKTPLMSKPFKLMLLSISAACAILLAHARTIYKLPKYGTVYYSVANGTSYYWTTVNPGLHFYACIGTSQAVYCTIIFTPSPTYTKVINGTLPPGTNYATPNWNNSLYRLLR